MQRPVTIKPPAVTVHFMHQQDQQGEVATGTAQLLYM